MPPNMLQRTYGLLAARGHAAGNLVKVGITCGEGACRLEA